MLRERARGWTLFMCDHGNKRCANIISTSSCHFWLSAATWRDLISKMMIWIRCAIVRLSYICIMCLAPHLGCRDGSAGDERNRSITRVDRADAGRAMCGINNRIVNTNVCICTDVVACGCVSTQNERNNRFARLHSRVVMVIAIIAPRFSSFNCFPCC